MVENLLSLLDNEFMKNLYADDIVRILLDIVTDPRSQVNGLASSLAETQESAGMLR